MSVEEEHAGVQEGMERSGWGNIPSRESEKVLERSYRRVTRVQERNWNDYTLAEGEKVLERSRRRDGEGTGEETGMNIPSRKVNYYLYSGHSIFLLTPPKQAVSCNKHTFRLVFCDNTF